MLNLKWRIYCCLLYTSGTLDDFIIARETEGQALKVLIEQRLEGVTAEVVKVRAHMQMCIRDSINYFWHCRQ